MTQVPAECEKLIEAIYASFLSNLCDSNNCVNAVGRQQFQTILKSEIPGGPELVALVDAAVWPEFLATHVKEIQEDCQSTDTQATVTTVRLVTCVQTLTYYFPTENTWQTCQNNFVRPH
jgi:hypothetical protein